MLHNMSSFVPEKYTAMSACTGASNSCDGFEIGKKPTESVFISTTLMQSMAAVQTDILV